MSFLDRNLGGSGSKCRLSGPKFGFQTELSGFQTDIWGFRQRILVPDRKFTLERMVEVAECQKTIFLSVPPETFLNRFPHQRGLCPRRAMEGSCLLEEPYLVEGSSPVEQTSTQAG